MKNFVLILIILIFSKFEYNDIRIFRYLNILYFINLHKLNIRILIIIYYRIHIF